LAILSVEKHALSIHIESRELDVPVIANADLLEFHEPKQFTGKRIFEVTASIPKQPLTNRGVRQTRNQRL
jgi:hypothetical protein